MANKKKIKRGGMTDGERRRRADLRRKQQIRKVIMRRRQYAQAAEL